MCRRQYRSARGWRVLSGTAGVVDHIMYAQIASEPGKPERGLLEVTGGSWCRGKTEDPALDLLGWRIEA